MPTSIAASVLMVLALLLWPHESRVDAAELLKRALEKQDAYAGPVRVERRSSEDGQWHVYQKWDTRTGRRIIYDFPGASFTYYDPRAFIAATYSAYDRRLFIGATSDAAVEQLPLPLNEPEFREYLDGEGYAVQSRPGDSALDIVLTLKPGSDISPEARRHAPAQILIQLDAESSMICVLKSRMKASDPWADFYRITYGDSADSPGPVDDIRAAIPPGTTVHDHRPSPEAAKYLAAIEDVRTRGFGFDTAVLITRTGSNFDLGSQAGSTAHVTLLSRKGDKWLRMTWDFADDPTSAPAGWPKPDLGQLVAAVANRRPGQYEVFDGTMRFLWGLPGNFARVSTGQPTTQHIARRERHAAANHRDAIANAVWNDPLSSLDRPGEIPCGVTVAPSPYASNAVILTITQYPNMGVISTRPVAHDPVPSVETRLQFYTDQGPYLLRFERTDHRWDSIPHGRYHSGDLRIDYDNPEGMYREPVRFPGRWRTTRPDEGYNLAHPTYDTLVPCPQQYPPDAWFGDPSKVWPELATTRPAD